MDKAMLVELKDYMRELVTGLATKEDLDVLAIKVAVLELEMKEAIKGLATKEFVTETITRELDRRFEESAEVQQDILSLLSDTIEDLRRMNVRHSEHLENHGLRIIRLEETVF